MPALTPSEKDKGCVHWKSQNEAHPKALPLNEATSPRVIESNQQLQCHKNGHWGNLWSWFITSECQSLSDLRHSSFSFKNESPLVLGPNQIYIRNPELGPVTILYAVSYHTKLKHNLLSNNSTQTHPCLGRVNDKTHLNGVLQVRDTTMPGWRCVKKKQRLDYPHV